MNASKNITNRMEIKLIKLARNEQYVKGIKIIDDFLKKKSVSDEILVQKAFFLYHYAAYLMYNKKWSTTKQDLIQQNFEDAIKICEAIIKKRLSTNKRNILNARIYLAQIYAMNGRTKKAKNFAASTFKSHPSFFTAERAADVYLRLNDSHRAISWYKKSIELAKQDDAKLMAQIGLAVTFKKTGNLKNALIEAKRAILLLEQSKIDKNTRILKQSLYANFPTLGRKNI